MDLILIAAIILGVLLIGAIFFRRYFKSIVLGLRRGLPFLSFSDTLLYATPLAGFDVGGLIAATLIYRKERKIVGAWAIIPALEAANFLVCMIPIIGEPIEFITNLTPAVFITRIIFSKYSSAEKAKQ